MIYITSINVTNWQYIITGVPNPQATDWYCSVACQEPGHTTGGEWWVNKHSFICIYSCLTWGIWAWAPPPVKSATALDSQRSTVNVMHLSHPETTPTTTLGHGKLVFHETGLWGLLCYNIILHAFMTFTGPKKRKENKYIFIPSVILTFFLSFLILFIYSGRSEKPSGVIFLAQYMFVPPTSFVLLLENTLHFCYRSNNTVQIFYTVNI